MENTEFVPVDLNRLKDIPFNDGTYFHCRDGSCVKGAVYLATYNLEPEHGWENSDSIPYLWSLHLRISPDSKQRLLYRILCHFETRLIQTRTVGQRDAVKEDLINRLREEKLGYDGEAL